MMNFSRLGQTVIVLSAPVCGVVEIVPKAEPMAVGQFPCASREVQLSGSTPRLSQLDSLDVERRTNLGRTTRAETGLYPLRLATRRNAVPYSDPPRAHPPKLAARLRDKSLSVPIGFWKAFSRRALFQAEKQEQGKKNTGFVSDFLSGLASISRCCLCFRSLHPPRVSVWREK